MSNDTNMKLCALLFGEVGHIITATPSLGLRTKVEVRVGTATPPCVNPYFGFTLIFSRDLGQVTSEKEGRGVCYAYDPSSDKPVPSDFTITVKYHSKVSAREYFLQSPASLGGDSGQISQG
ncbi:hypothetical protein AU210_014954 [Fusarium oxysporum f. sp. radicis-cucumerinum]|uniref:Uncharacterized protein n=2 Tax=Fusarium oxysporum TaxID=5507 RepID=A0A2H3GCM0_FUSOX|nr:hypothetical protein AU210_014954 [Fusarium oxysporum f. sp. radicis-cucumerinum]RKK89201.1 hypothetical protein BFJ71_g12454 [Fusarium oxysporum]RKL10654.1 hypothetical protein BFJ68_g8632 [Fusarium oxysporum]